MIAIFIFIVACGLTIFVFKKTRSLKEQARDNEIRYHLLKSSLEFLVPFAFVMFCYVGLLAVVSMAWESISLQSLIRLEEWLTTIHSYTKLKPSKTMVFGMFLGIYALGLLRVILLETRKKLYTDIDTFYKWTKRLYVVFVLLCSFTLLGTQFGRTLQRLEDPYQAYERRLCGRLQTNSRGYFRRGCIPTLHQGLRQLFTSTSRGTEIT